MEILVDPEEMIICPYNNAHHIRRMKMPLHLVRCKKNYPDARMVTCDFNASHQIPEPELQYHHENCPNRKEVEITVYVEEGQYIDKFPVSNVPVETSDTWDDCNHAGYDPTLYCETNNVVRKLDVESAAKKKNFHHMERNRVKNISENTDDQSSARAAETTSQPTKKPTKFRKPTFLPKTESAPVVTEETPDDITDLVERIKLGARKPYNSATAGK